MSGTNYDVALVIALDLPFVLPLVPNPNSFSLSVEKNNNSTLTNTGYFRTSSPHFEPKTLSFRGVTYGKTGDPWHYGEPSVVLSTSFILSLLYSLGGITKDPSLLTGPDQWAIIDANFRKLKQIVETDRKPLGRALSGKTSQELSLAIKHRFAEKTRTYIYFKDCLYMGEISNFSYSISAQQQRVLEWSLTYKSFRDTDLVIFSERLVSKPWIRYAQLAGDILSSITTLAPAVARSYVALTSSLSMGELD